MNEVIEVTKEQYEFFRTKFSGIVAHRYDKDQNKYYIKIMLSKYIETIKLIMQNVKH